MKNKLVLALAAVVLMGAPAFAAIQNVKVSGDIDSTYLNRQDFSLGTKTAAGMETAGLINQNAFITQTTLKVDADLSDNVSTTVGLINERAWDTDNATTTAANAGGNGSTFSGADTNVQLYLAYATMREFLYSPLTVTVGRQFFNYGNGLIIGADGSNNSANGPLANVAVDFTKKTTYDGIKATLDYKPLTLDLLYFINTTNLTNGGGLLTGIGTGSSATSDDSSVFGINANYQLGDAMNTVAEAYFFARINGKKNAVLTGTKDDQVLVPGLRVSTNPVKGLNTQVEVAWQGGTKAVTTAGTAGGDNIRRSAMAYQFMASYAIPLAKIEKYKPTVNASFTHVSGDKNAGDTRSLGGVPASKNVYTAWDPMFENQGGGTIYNTLFNLTNMNIVSAGFSATPIQDVTAAVTWSGLWADRRVGTANGTNNPLTFLQPDGTAVAPATTSHRAMGNEYDLNMNYNYTEDVLLGVNLGWFVPSHLFTSANRNTASQAIAHVDVNF